MASPKKQMASEEWFATADEFMVATALFEAHRKRHGILAVPHVACSAFASEAYLKCLLTLHGKQFPPEHDLHLLFGLLPSTDKRIIEEWWNAATLPNLWTAAMNPPPGIKVPGTLAQCLKASRNAFKEWRYKTKATLSWYLGGFPANVRTRILVLKPEWGSTPPKLFPGNPKT